MPKMTDPMDALNSFQQAFRAKVLELENGALDPTILVHFDRPAGDPRFTYTRVKPAKFWPW